MAVSLLQRERNRLLVTPNPRLCCGILWICWKMRYVGLELVKVMLLRIVHFKFIFDSARAMPNVNMWSYVLPISRFFSFR